MHEAHTVAPETLENVPDGQGEHPPAALPSMNVPALQLEAEEAHVDDPAMDVVLMGQDRHATMEAPDVEGLYLFAAHSVVALTPAAHHAPVEHGVQKEEELAPDCVP